MKTINQQLAYWRNIAATTNDSTTHTTACLHILALLDERRNESFGPFSKDA